MTANPSKPGDKRNPRISSSEARRANKPLMEKRRRARINSSLSILKALIVDTSKEKKKPMEKADILEYTVSYLQRHKLVNSGDVDEHKFVNGYQECTKAVVKFLESCNIDSSTLENLVEFLRVRRQSKKEFEGIKIAKTTNCFNKQNSIVNKYNNLSGTVPSSISTVDISHTENMLLVEELGMDLDSSEISYHESHHSIPTLTNNHNSINNNFTQMTLRNSQLTAVNLSRDSCLCNCNSHEPPIDLINRAPSSNLSSISSYENDESTDDDLPLNLCCKTNSCDGQGVWRPW